MSVALARHWVLETVQVESALAFDGQGARTYDTPVDVEVKAARQTKMVLQTDGSSIRTVLTLWVPADAALLPNEQDRITWQSNTYIAVDVKHVNGRDGQLVHRRARCKRE